MRELTLHLADWLGPLAVAVGLVAYGRVAHRERGGSALALATSALAVGAALQPVDSAWWSLAARLALAAMTGPCALLAGRTVAKRRQGV